MKKKVTVLFWVLCFSLFVFKFDIQGQSPSKGLDEYIAQKSLNEYLDCSKEWGLVVRTASLSYVSKDEPIFNYLKTIPISKDCNTNHQFIKVNNTKALEVGGVKFDEGYVILNESEFDMVIQVGARINFVFIVKNNSFSKEEILNIFRKKMNGKIEDEVILDKHYFIKNTLDNFSFEDTPFGIVFIATFSLVKQNYWFDKANVVSMTNRFSQIDDDMGFNGLKFQTVLSQDKAKEIKLIKDGEKDENGLTQYHVENENYKIFEGVYFEDMLVVLSESRTLIMCQYVKSNLSLEAFNRIKNKFIQLFGKPRCFIQNKNEFLWIGNKVFMDLDYNSDRSLVRFTMNVIEL